MTPEQRAALCEYVDGQRAAGRSYDAIADMLDGHIPDAALSSLEAWHREWKQGEWRKEQKRQRREVELGDNDVPQDPASEPWTAGGPEIVRYLVQRLLGADVIANGKVRWKFLCWRSLKPGQTCETRKGPGSAGGVCWLMSSVIFRTGDQIDHVEPESRIRDFRKPGSATAAKLGFKRNAVRLEKLSLVAERLNLTECSAKLAALLQTFLGSNSGIRSGAHLGRLTKRSRAAVSARKLRIAESYYEQTGGKAGFENLHSAQRHRDKVKRRGA